MDKEKAEAYDKLLVKAKQIYNKENDVLIIHTLEDFFPELRESEDEKIRKELIEHVKDQQSSFISAPDCRDKYEEEENDKYNSWLAWLEKQGKEDSSIQQAYEWGYTEGKRIERKHWVEKQKFSEDYNSIDPQFGKPIEQNHAWSEEDENNIDTIISVYHPSPKIVNWLKSLKQRIGG